jgi:hypothetical protein
VHRAAILPESVHMGKLQRSDAEERRTPWRDAGCGQTSALAAGPATRLPKREGECGPGVSGRSHSGRGAGRSRATASPRWARIRAMTARSSSGIAVYLPADAFVIDGGSQFSDCPLTLPSPPVGERVANRT